ncbi:MAG: ECF transporter S component [Candidatus Bathyarchaeia archaeon]
MTILSEKRKEKNKNKGTTEIYNQQIPKALMLTLISINAALYAVAIAVTSPIPTPWGIGHFRPGVVIPAFFTVVFGPLIGGLGAAIGCFLGDFALSFFGLTTPMLSLVAGVPGNFIGFYVLGWLISKNRSYSSFIISNFVALLIGNFVAALGVLAYFVFIVPDWILWPISLQIAVVAGLTLFWVSTMVVFVTPLVPVMVTYIEPTLSKIGVKGISNLSPSSRTSIVKSAGLVAIFLIAIYSVLSFTPGGDMLFAGVVPPEILLLSACVIFVTGLIFSLLASKLMKGIS